MVARGRRGSPAHEAGRRSTVGRLQSVGAAGRRRAGQLPPARAPMRRAGRRAERVMTVPAAGSMAGGLPRRKQSVGRHPWASASFGWTSAGAGWRAAAQRRVARSTGRSRHRVTRSRDRSKVRVTPSPLPRSAVPAGSRAGHRLRMPAEPMDRSPRDGARVAGPNAVRRGDWPAMAASFGGPARAPARPSPGRASGRWRSTFPAVARARVARPQGLDLRAALPAVPASPSIRRPFAAHGSQAPA